MLTNKGYSALIQRIIDTGGFTHEMEEDIRKLEGELNERDGLLSRYGETYDGEKNEWEFQEFPVKNYENEYNEMKAKYDDIVKRYNDTFYNKTEDAEKEIVTDETESDVTINDLLTDIS